MGDEGSNPSLATMKVRDLIDKLDDLNQDLEVVCYSPHGSVRGDIDTVTIAEWSEADKRVFIEFTPEM